MISNVLRCVIIGLLIFSLVHAQETKGTPGVDYPSFGTIPNTSFMCSDQEFIPGFYADLEAQCQVYHYCSEDGQETFLCPIGSIFNQAKLACDIWHNSNCTVASQLYSSNSGFLLESAMKNVPLLIKVRNRANNRLFREANIHEKITSLHGGSKLDQSSTHGSSVSNDVNADQNPDINEDNQREQLNEDEALDDILNRLEESIQNDEPADGIYNGDRNGDASDNMQSNLFFDPVTEQYYVDPESSQNEWSPNFGESQFGYYDRENFAYKYGLAMQDAAESRDLYGLNEMNNEEATDQFLKRQMDIEQPFRRLRRKPIYTVTQDEDERPSGMRDGMDSVMDTEDDVTTESVLVVTGVDSQPSEEITAGTERVTYTMAPFDMVEDLSRMHMTPLNITEVPMTSEEFEDAIISELIVPKIDEHDLRVLGSTYDQEQPSEGNADETSSDVQNDGYYRYVENESPEQFEYSNMYDAESEAENLETDSRASYQIDDTAEYYQDETADGDPGKSDDTFVVIPDESEIPEFSEAFDTSASSEESSLQSLSDQNVNEDAADDSIEFNIPTNYEYPGVYSTADKSQYRNSRYSQSAEYYPDPEQYFRERYLNEKSSSPYDYADESYAADDARAMDSEHHQHGFEAHDPTNQYMYTPPGSYACQQQIGYGNCMYGSQSGFPYAGYYDNPYVNFPYGVSDMQESSESPVSGVDGSYTSESPMSYMIQSAPNMNNEQFEINPVYERPNSYQDQISYESDYHDEQSAPDNSGAVLGNESVDQETFYVLEDDEPTLEVDPESVSEPSSRGNMDGVSDVTGNQGETYYILEDEDEEKGMEDSPEVKTFTDLSESKEMKEQQAFPQDKPPHLEESSPEHSVDVMSSQTADYKDVSQSEENSALGDDGAESSFGSIMDSRFTHVTNDGPFTTKSDRNGEVQLDSSEQLTRSDETSKVLVSSHGNLPNMFLNNMAYSDSINFGSHGFGSNLGQPMTGGTPTTFSFANGQKRTDASPNVSKLSALQERIRSLKQGKFGAFKKYVNSPGSKN